MLTAAHPVDLRALRSYRALERPAGPQGSRRYGVMAADLFKTAAIRQFSGWLTAKPETDAV